MQENRIKDIHEKGLENLRIAIVRQAAADYISKNKTLANMLEKKKQDESLRLRIRQIQSEIIDLRKFFYSDYYDLLCDIPADILLSRLDSEAMVPRKRHIIL